ncbi:PadR family transcriptional regulator [Actinoplanes sp. CA-051413]|uniref:PadR family transcriptional regulator n=1 Tax=Actinoplanes sp. CA-051413 TaxID=3239899 RepID=UPI003D95C859
MGRELTPAELLVMGLLAERPRHGYDLDQVIAARGMREWTPIAFSSLYYLLRKLETDGLIAPVTGGSPRRRVYAPTSAGRQLTAEATRRALATLSPPHPPVLIGLANAPMLDRATTVEALHARGRAITAELERLTAHRDQQAAGAPPAVAALFDYALAMLDAEHGWVRRTIESLEASDVQS